MHADRLHPRPLLQHRDDALTPVVGHHRRLTLAVVSDHVTGRVVWVANTYNTATLGSFFDQLADQAAGLEFVTADGAKWVHDLVAKRAPQAEICLDAFHIVAWATDAVDEVRRSQWQQLRRLVDHDEAALGEKLRGGTPEADTALSRQGRYHTAADNLGVKEVVIDDATMRDRFVICQNPDAAERDLVVRAQLLETLTERIDGSEALTAEKRAVLAARLPAGSAWVRQRDPPGVLSGSCCGRPSSLWGGRLGVGVRR